jgi:hypothetical protein
MQPAATTGTAISTISSGLPAIVSSTVPITVERLPTADVTAENSITFTSFHKIYPNTYEEVLSLSKI